MALVKKCPTCGHGNLPRRMTCERDGVVLSGVGLTEEAEPQPEPEPTLEQAGNAEPVRDPLSSQPVLELHFPLGNIVEIRKETVIGRDNPDFALIGEAENGSYVSGRHAVILCRDGRFFVRHIGRQDSNLTYIDDREIQGEEEVRDGQTLSFSRFFRVPVRIR
ncbi:MAG TPA: FHA domain-containing protein [Allosphingosinicella sp.]